MKTIINIVLLLIVLGCAWAGYKKGVIMGVGGVIAIIIAVYGANLLANTFSFDVIPALKPFASGFMEKQLTSDDGVMRRMGWDSYDYSVDDLLQKFPDQEQQFCTTCYEALGIDESAAGVMGKEAVTYAVDNSVDIMTAVVQVLCARASYVACFVLGFLLIIIILTVIGNLPNLSYKLPNLDLVNDIGGAVLGAVTGLMFCAILVWTLKFMGKLIGENTLSSAWVAKLFLRKNFLFTYLGI